MNVQSTSVFSSLEHNNSAHSAERQEGKERKREREREFVPLHAKLILVLTS